MQSSLQFIPLQLWLIHRCESRASEAPAAVFTLEFHRLCPSHGTFHFSWVIFISFMRHQVVKVSQLRLRPQLYSRLTAWILQSHMRISFSLLAFIMEGVGFPPWWFQCLIAPIFQSFSSSQQQGTFQPCALPIKLTCSFPFRVDAFFIFTSPVIFPSICDNLFPWLIKYLLYPFRAWASNLPSDGSFVIALTKVCVFSCLFTFL